MRHAISAMLVHVFDTPLYFRTLHVLMIFANVYLFFLKILKAVQFFKMLEMINIYLSYKTFETIVGGPKLFCRVYLSYTATRSKAIVLLLFIHCLTFLLLFAGFCGRSLIC